MSAAEQAVETGVRRRDQILAAAAELFHERGYHATGMDDIGAASGITGPGIYRHFRGKEEILETLIREQGETAIGEIRRLAGAELPPRAKLDALASHYVATLLDSPEVAHLAVHERRILRRATRAWVERMEREQIDAWVHVLRQLRPELSDAEARMIVRAALGLGLSVCTYRGGIDRASLAELITSMMKAALLGRDGVRKRR